MAFLKNDKSMINRGPGQILHFLRKVPLKRTSGIKDPPEYVFRVKKLKNHIETALKPTGIKLQANLIKIYQVVYICEKKNATL